MCENEEEMSMLFYWPCAVYKDEKYDEPQKLFIYNPVTTRDKALKQIFFWRDVYKFDITRAWIDITDGNGFKETEEVPIEQTFSEGLEGV